MSAPDKIYVAISHPISKNYTEMTGFMERGSNDEIEYIRKDYLLELIEEEEKFWDDGEMIFRRLKKELNEI